MTKKDTQKDAKQDDPEQSRRFIETAKAVNVDEKGKGFEKAINSIAPNKK